MQCASTIFPHQLLVGNLKWNVRLAANSHAHHNQKQTNIGHSGTRNILMGSSKKNYTQNIQNIHNDFDEFSMFVCESFCIWLAHFCKARCIDWRRSKHNVEPESIIQEKRAIQSFYFVVRLKWYTVQVCHNRVEIFHHQQNVGQRYRVYMLIWTHD